MRFGLIRSKTYIRMCVSFACRVDALLLQLNSTLHRGRGRRRSVRRLGWGVRDIGSGSR